MHVTSFMFKMETVMTTIASLTTGTIGQATRESF
jgi:hypothetical protein